MGCRFVVGQLKFTCWMKSGRKSHHSCSIKWPTGYTLALGIELFRVRIPACLPTLCLFRGAKLRGYTSEYIYNGGWIVMNIAICLHRSQFVLRMVRQLDCIYTNYSACLISLVFKSSPYRIEEEGWGEFDMQIVLTAPDKDHIVPHDLNFQKNRYDAKHVIVSFRFPNSFVLLPCNLHTLTFTSLLPRPSKTPSQRSSPYSKSLVLFPGTKMAWNQSAQGVKKKGPKRKSV